MTIKEKVEHILKNYPVTRDSDQSLIVTLWWYYHRPKLIEDEGKWFINLRSILELEKPETITRCRRKFQEEGKYPASPEVQAKRKGYEEDMRQSMPRYGWEYADYLNE